MSNVDFNVKGLKELNDTILELSKAYPDETRKGLRQTANKFKKSVRKKIQERTDPKSGQLESTSGVKVGKILEGGQNFSIDIYGNKRHFHLIENGHMQLDKNGKIVGKGFVPGFHMMRDTITEYQTLYPEEIEAVMDYILKKKGLV